jgi:hypothetical protein
MATSPIDAQKKRRPAVIAGLSLLVLFDAGYLNYIGR